MSFQPNSSKKLNLVDVEFSINDFNIEDIFDEILSWAEETNVKIINQMKPFRIDAKHGTSLTISMDHMKWSKKFTFLLTQEEEVKLRIIINPPWYDRFQSNANETRRKWLEFMEPLFLKLGVEQSDYKPEELFNESNYVTEYYKLNRNMYVSAIVTLLAFLYDVLSVIYLPEIMFMEQISVISAIVFVASFIGARNVKKRLTSPDLFLQNKNPNRNLKYLTYIVIILFIGGFYWTWNAPTETTFSRYGISFEYDRRWDIETEGMSEDLASRTQGQISLNPSDETLISIIWVSSEYLDPGWTLEGAIDSGLANVFNSLNEREIPYTHYPGIKRREIINEHLHVEEHGGLEWSGTNHTYIISWRRCTTSDRVFGMIYLSTTGTEDFIYYSIRDSLRCHQ